MKRTVQNMVLLALAIVTALFLLLVLTQKLKLGQVRYFDADELAYLHWAHNVFVGKRPFIDFFFYVPPGFLWFLAPLFFFVKGAEILTTSRVVAFIIFVLMGAVSGLILYQIRKPKNAIESLWVILLPAALLAFLPLPADKMLEMRPDNVTTLVALLGLYLQIRWIENQKKHFAWWAGIAYGASLLLLPKSLPQVAVAVVVAIFASQNFPKKAHQLCMFVLGIGIPMCVFGLWILFASKGITDIQLILYSLTKLPLEVNKIGQLFPMQPDLFFYPNNVYYGTGGWSSGLLANHFLWIVGLLFGSLRLVTPWIAGKDNQGAWIEILLAGTLFVYILTFIYGYPLRHAQYLIPIAVLVVIYLADLLFALWKVVSQSEWQKTLFLAIYICMSMYLWSISNDVNGPKLSWTNTEDIRTLTFALQTIPKDAYVLDLVGATIYFRDPAYGCCLPLGQYSQFLSRPVNLLSGGLRYTNAQYIYQGRLFRLHDIDQADQQYVEANYRPLTTDKTWLIHN